MKKEVEKVVDFGEYLVEMNYTGKGDLVVSVFDEIGGLIESIDISNAEDE